MRLTCRDNGVDLPGNPESVQEQEYYYVRSSITTFLPSLSLSLKSQVQYNNIVTGIALYVADVSPVLCLTTYDTYLY